MLRKAYPAGGGGGRGYFSLLKNKGQGTKRGSKATVFRVTEQSSIATRRKEEGGEGFVLRGRRVHIGKGEVLNLVHQRLGHLNARPKRGLPLK